MNIILSIALFLLGCALGGLVVQKILEKSMYELAKATDDLMESYDTLIRVYRVKISMFEERLRKYEHIEEEKLDEKE